MARQGLHSVVKRNYNHHTSHGSVPNNKENILKRDLKAETINQKWCTDIISMYRKKDGWLLSWTYAAEK